MRKRVAREQALWYEEELNKEIEKKKEILKELRIFGIAEETLFADSIDSVCKGIKGQF